MKIEDFENAIHALGVNGLEITEVRYSATNGGEVQGVYGKIGELTFLWWDANGRGFRFDINPNQESCTVVSHPEYLNYVRDDDFDLKFD
ncbi:MAG: hypothetical protein II886_13600 [Prevotella sp.]|nr:hypothetical protein [Prevotella sp.]